MASKACNAKFLLDGYDMSGQSSGCAITLDSTAIEYDRMDSCVALRLPTAPATVFDHNGYYTAKTAGYLEKETYDRLGATADNYIGYIPDSSLTVAPAYVIDNTFAAQLKMDAPIKGLLTVTGQWPTGDYPTARGYVVYAGTVSATGVKTQVDFGAAGSAGGRAFLFIRAITGTATNATVVVESCATSGGTYDAEGTFTFSTAVPNAYAIDLSGTVNRYIHINTTSKGGATSFDVTVIVAIAGVTK